MSIGSAEDRHVQFFSSDQPREGEAKRDDGRVVAFAQWGTETGTPLVVLWGSPNSRLWCPPDVGEAHVVTFDRPGWGRSTPDPEQTLPSFAADVGAVMDALSITSFSVLGLSGGVPYACACAATLSARVQSLALVAGPGPQPRPDGFVESNPGFPLLIETLARDRDQAKRMVLAIAEPWVAEPESFFGEASKRRFADRNLLEAGLRDAFRQGADGLFGDLACWFTPWPFRLSEIAAPTSIWIGDQDVDLLADARYLASHITGARLTMWPGVDHLGVAPHLRSVIDDVLSAGRAAA